MDVVHRRCCGIDIAEAGAKVCVRVQGAGRRRTEKAITDWSSMYADVLGLREYLIGRAGHVCGDGSYR